MIDRSRIWSENIKLIENGRYWDKRTERKNKKRMKTPNWNSASYFSFDQCSLFLASLLALRTQKSHPHSNRYNTVYNISGEEESSQENFKTQIQFSRLTIVFIALREVVASKTEMVVLWLQLQISAIYTPPSAMTSEQRRDVTWLMTFGRRQISFRCS